MRKVVGPLLELMFDSGVTVQQFNLLAREMAVTIARNRLAKGDVRNSNSRVSLMTGLPRSEVAKILRSPSAQALKRSGQNSSRRVVSGWHEDPSFLSPSGEPAILPIFGKSRSFERLVALYGGGIPVRAMLDELKDIGAVEILKDHSVRVRSRVPILTGFTSSAISALGERGRDLLETLNKNVRCRTTPLFEATAVIEDADQSMLPLIQREILAQGTSFISGISSLLNRSQVKSRLPRHLNNQKRRVGVTLYYFEDETAETGKKGTAKPVRRKNLRRLVQSFENQNLK